MSCDSGRTKPISPYALLFVIAVAWPHSASSESADCYTVRRGETATQLARRITGDGRNKYQTWFQIMDALSRSVPKSQYDRIRPGWRACVVKETSASPVQPAAQQVRDVALQRQVRTESVARATPQPTVTTATPWVSGFDLALVWIGAAVVLPLFGWKMLDDYLARRRTALLVMRHFAHRFVREFERPLIQAPEELPLRARLRLFPARGRVDILLAPGNGKRYPNLSDHRKNVEYDVIRIAHLLNDDSFVCDPLYTHAEWVVVPFRFNLGRKHTGVT
jgi:hypothetical protein